jgi:hypothetical protein
VNSKYSASEYLKENLVKQSKIKQNQYSDQIIPMLSIATLNLGNLIKPMENEENTCSGRENVFPALGI